MTAREWETVMLDACGAWGVDPRGPLAAATLSSWARRFMHLEAAVVAVALVELQLEQAAEPQRSLVRQLPPVGAVAQRIKRVLERRRPPGALRRLLPPPAMLPHERRELADELDAQAGTLAHRQPLLAVALVKMADDLRGDALRQEQGQALGSGPRFGSVVQALQQGRGR